MSVFDEIRAACARVAARARWVRLDEAALAAYARTLEDAPLPGYDRSHHYWGAPEGVVAYLVTLDAVNFGSGYFPHLVKRPGLSGYFTVALALKARFEARGPWRAGDLAALTPAACAEVFGQPPGDALREELMGLFAAALNELGRYLLARFGGSFTALVAAAEGSAARLLEHLGQMPFYQDVARYRGFSVPFYKRAQITASDLALAFGGEGYGRFDDLSELTIFADNLVPHVLHVDGVLRYHPELAARLARGEPLAPGSAEEVELRALALYAAERLKVLLRASGRDVSAQDLDLLLWNRGQAPRYRKAPRHRTRTVFY